MFALSLALTVYAVVDCVQTDEHRVRGLPKIVWAFLILLFPLAGPIAWFLAGRPARAGSSPSGRETPWGPLQRPQPPRGPRPPRGPDDDPDFLRGL